MPYHSPSASIKLASRFAFLLGAFTIAAMLTGVFLISALGGSSGRDLGANATGVALANAAPLLVLAELLKLVIGTCQAMLVRNAVSVQRKRRAAALLSGYVGAALITASGMVGIYAVIAQSRGIGAMASALAFGSAAATAAWVILFVSSATMRLRPWHRSVGFTFAGASLLSLLVAQAALVGGMLGLAWWFGLSKAFAAADAP